MWQTLKKIFSNEVSWNGPISRDSFIVVCKNAYLLNLRPFDNSVIDHKCYKRLNFIADQYAIENKLSELTGCLAEGQYYINFLAAYFILEKFKPKKEEKLIVFNSDKSIVEDCIETCDRYAEHFEAGDQSENYHKWITKIKSYYNIA